MLGSMGEPSEFERAYFQQTRTEIENDKRERDFLLNVAVVIVGGGTVVAVGGGLSPNKAFTSGATLALVIPGLALISGLMWIRREKLKQIADRWEILYSLLGRRLDSDWVSASLEARVVRGLH